METPSPTRLLLVRHGQTTWNEEHRWQGQADPPLSDHGRRQAIAASETIGVVDVIVSSPQVRALETATIISELIGDPASLQRGFNSFMAGYGIR